MKPIAIFRHSPGEGPGYFATYLDAHSLAWELIAVDAGEPIPATHADFSGLVFMGGPMSANDALPWIAPVLDLIRSAVAADKPVLGHCLGGQLMARALGGSVSRNPVKEIGWGEVMVEPGPAADDWLPGLDRFAGFHWHGETFTLPLGSARLLSSPHCRNQAFVLGNALGMQCHVEMLPEMIEHWCEIGAGEIERARAKGMTASVQTTAEMALESPRRIPALHEVAAHLYARWIRGIGA
ncbi:MAG: type 1 glutamine amidotransferase [Rhodocyclaceae bacterium]|nr:type 1 glutamine amidotransferase [Rhodocyclaceae bacterium]